MTAPEPKFAVLAFVDSSPPATSQTASNNHIHLARLSAFLKKFPNGVELILSVSSSSGSSDRLANALKSVINRRPISAGV